MGATTTGLTDPPVGVPQLAWTTVAAATRYQVEISTSPGFADSVVSAVTHATTFTPDSALADGDYFWRVKAGQRVTWGPYSEVRTFRKVWGAQGALAPHLLSPPPDAVRRAFAATDFSWTPVSGAATYLLELSSDPAFATLAYRAVTLKPQHTPTTRLPSNRYYWRVIPTDARDNRGEPSAVGSFTFAWDQPPQLLAPADTIDTPYLPRFAWTAVEAARLYRLEISTQPDFSAVTAYETVHTEFTPAKALSNDQDYYWHVKAVDAAGHSSPWSVTRRFRMRWNFQAQPLTPLNNAIKQSYPFFSWTPIPGVERYEVQVDESSSFQRPLMKVEVFNASMLSIVEITEQVIYIDQDYFWRVRGIDAQDNYTPWSNTTAFRFGGETSPTLVYPLYYYPPDRANLPVHRDLTVAWPLFIWDSAHLYDPAGNLVPDTYEVTVASDPAFQQVNFQLTTRGEAAAPTTAHPFTNLQDGQLYYWRVRARRGGLPIGVDQTWVTRIDRTANALPVGSTPTLIHPADGFGAVGVPPVLGWTPVSGVALYRVQISRDPAFATVLDEAEAHFVNYVPWQGQASIPPFGAFWWRVRPESAPGTPLADWSTPRRFFLARDLVTGNPYDLPPPPAPSSLLQTTATYNPALSYIAESPAGSAGDYELGALHVMLDRTYNNTLNWVLAFKTSATVANTVTYGLLIDSDHQLNSGANVDERRAPLPVNPYMRPEYLLYVERTGNSVTPTNVRFYAWNGTSWLPAQTLATLGGDAWYAPDSQAVQLLVPYTALGAGAENFSGSLGVTVFSSNGPGATTSLDQIPPQGATFDQPAYVSDMLLPLYPFDTPLGNPFVHYDLPILRWRMPNQNSVDGYQVQVARDARFTDLVETWELAEKEKHPFYAFLSAAFQSLKPYADNESYYWRVRVRHERYTSLSSQYDYGPWSPTMRFKLDSRQVGNPQLASGAVSSALPSFQWEHVEGAAGYTLQISNDSNFSNPLLNLALDSVSYTPVETLPDGAYFWRVAARRSRTVIGHWTPALPFTKRSPVPLLLSPPAGAILDGQPTFTWSAVLTPTASPRLAAARYRLQISADPNFSTPRFFTTDATTFTLPERESLADGAWHWRVAVIDAQNQVGPYSAPQQFYKEYPPPTLLAPAQGTPFSGITSFTWEPVAGAAAYEIEIDDNALFASPVRAKTDNAQYTPLNDLPPGDYFWRVRMIDADRRPGPFQLGRVTLLPPGTTPSLFLPVVANR